MNPDPFALEEYKRIIHRQELHEMRHYQMLALCVTGFAAVLSFSDKLSAPLVPYVLASLVLLTSRVAMLNWQLGQFNAAFLLVHFQLHYPALTYEGAYNSLFLRSLTSAGGLWRQARRAIGFATRDFILLNLMAVGATLYFSWGYVSTSIFTGHLRIAFAYAAPLAAMHALAIAVVIRGIRRSVLEFQVDLVRHVALMDRSGVFRETKPVG